MSVGLFFRTMWRETRGARGRLAFFAACVAVGVAAVVGVSGLADAIEAGIRARSRELLGGDVALESRRPLPAPSQLRAGLPQAAQVAMAEVALLPTMVRTASDQSRLAELRAFSTTSGVYPLAGEIRVHPARPRGALVNDDSVLIAPEIAKEWSVRIGDTLRIGVAAFRVAGIILHEPDPLTLSFALGPRILMTKRGLERTELLGFGSRIRYRTLLSYPADTSDAALARIKRDLTERVPGGGSYVTIETRSEAQPALRSTLDKVQRYVGLVALLSLLLASVGVAQIVSTWLSQAAPQTAILRCLGFLPREVVALYLGHVMLLALVGSALGALLGASVPSLVARAYPELLPEQLLTQLPVFAMLRGLLLGVGVAVLFSLPPLTSVWKVSPVRVLRSEAAPLPVPRNVRLAASTLTALSVFGAAFAQTGDLRASSAFALGVSALAGLLWLGARAVLWGAEKLPRARLSAIVRQGVAAVARPGAGTTGSIVALGLGTLVVLTISLVEGILGHEIDTALPPDAPSLFLVDIQSDQWPGVARLCHEAGAERVTSAPVIMARLSAINGRTLDELLKQRSGELNQRGREHWILTREQRITSARELPRDNEIVAGALWSRPGVPELSLEVDFARDLKVGLGDQLRFDVQGVPMDFTVSSLRTVSWRSFSMNFFLVAEPGTLDDAPQIRLGTARIAQAAEQQLQNDLTRLYPNITVLRVRSLLSRVSDTLVQVAVAVRLLGSFAALTGLIILAGAVASSQLRRAREAALWKALGLTRAEVALLFGVEYALHGAVAGLLGAAGAYVLTLGFARYALSMSTLPSLSTCLVAVLAATGLSVVGGLLASARALRVRPLEVFREQS